MDDDLRHWDVEDSFTIDQVPALCLGIDPLRDDRTKLEAQRIAIVRARLQRDATLAADIVHQAVSAAIAAIPEIERTTALVTASIGRELAKVDAYCSPVSQETRHDIQFRSQGFDLKPDEPQTFWRRDIEKWLERTGFDSKYAFARQPLSVAIPVKGPSDGDRAVEPRDEVTLSHPAVARKSGSRPVTPQRMDALSSVLHAHLLKIKAEGGQRPSARAVMDAWRSSKPPGIVRVSLEGVEWMRGEGDDASETVSLAALSARIERMWPKNSR